MTITNDIRTKVANAFNGFIGNAEAVHALKRELACALSSDPPQLDKAFLLVGSRSTGKTDLSRRITQCLGVPFVSIDGVGIRNREELFDMIDELLESRGLYPKRVEDQAGLPTYEYPPFVVLIDECHLIPARARESLLTALESDDRSIVLNKRDPRRRAIIRGSTFIFATTRPTELDDPFRSRCAEINLRRYTKDEMVSILRVKCPYVPSLLLEDLATTSRLIPRVAIAMADEWRKEKLYGDLNDQDAFVSVAKSRSIVGRNGLTQNDVRLLKLLDRERKPVSESGIIAGLSDLDRAVVRDDIEQYLIMINFVRVTEKGRELTQTGKRWLDDHKREESEASQMKLEVR